MINASQKLCFVRVLTRRRWRWPWHPLGRYNASTHPMAASSGFAWSHLYSPSGDVPRAVSSWRHASEAALYPLQPCYFAKWDIFADTSDYQYVMGIPVCILNNFLPLFPISCHFLMSEWDCPIFEKLLFPKIWILLHLYFSVSLSNLACYNLIIML